MNSWKILIFAALSVSAHATLHNRGNIPLGDKESMQANTGIAASESSGAVYYNPAALSTIEDSRLSMSGSAYMIYQFDVKPMLKVDDSYQNYSADGFQSIPSSVIAIRKSGDWRLGFAILVPESLELENHLRWNSSGALNMDMDITQSKTEHELWMGPSASYPINDNWSLGVSVFGTRYSNLETTSFTGVLNAIPNSISSEVKRVKIEVYGVQSVLAAFYKGETWRWGFSFSPPTVQVMGKAEYFQNQQAVVNGSLVTNQRVENTEMDGNRRLPAQVGMGVGARITSRLSLLMDGYYQFHEEYSLISGQANSVSVDQKIRHRSIGRGSLGIEFRINPRTNWTSGAFYIPSSNGDINLDGSKENYWGVTSGVQLGVENIRTGIGVFYFEGKGEEVIIGTNERAPFNSRVFGLLLSTTYQF